GRAVPADGQFAGELDDAFERLYRWLDGTDAGDLSRPELTDPAALAAARLIHAGLAAAYFIAHPAMIAWLALAALRIWIDDVPDRTLVGPAGHAAYHAAVQRAHNAAPYQETL